MLLAFWDACRTYVAASRIYAVIGRVRIQSCVPVVEKAEEAARTIIETYSAPNNMFSELRQLAGSPAIDPLRSQSQECRAELSQLRRICTKVRMSL